jgi:hypothetical protein
MPFKSKAQQRWMYAAEDRGEVSEGTAQDWSDATKKKKGGIKALPEKVKQKKTAEEVADNILKEATAMSPMAKKLKYRKIKPKKLPSKIAEEVWTRHQARG